MKLWEMAFAWFSASRYTHAVLKHLQKMEWNLRWLDGWNGKSDNYSPTLGVGDLQQSIWICLLLHGMRNSSFASSVLLLVG